MKPRTWLILAVVLVLARPLSAEQEILQQGDRLRLTASEFQANPLEGDLVSLSERSLRMQIAYGEYRGETRDFALANIDALAVQRMGQSTAGRNALIGAGIGFLVGFGVASVADSGCNELGCPDSRVTGGILGGLFGLLGAGVGALSGAPHQSWEPVPLDSLAASGADPGQGDALR